MRSVPFKVLFMFLSKRVTVCELLCVPCNAKGISCCQVNYVSYVRFTYYMKRPFSCSVNEQNNPSRDTQHYKNNEINNSTLLAAKSLWVWVEELMWSVFWCEHLFSFFVSQISRCLKPGGRFVSVTFADPFFRKRLYAKTQYNWSIRQYSYGEGLEYFVYVMTKGEELSPQDAALEKKLLEDVKSKSSVVFSTQSENEEDFITNIDLWERTGSLTGKFGIWPHKIFWYSWFTNSDH